MPLRFGVAFVGDRVLRGNANMLFMMAKDSNGEICAVKNSGIGVGVVASGPVVTPSVAKLWVGCCLRILVALGFLYVGGLSAIDFSDPASTLYYREEYFIFALLRDFADSCGIFFVFGGTTCLVALLGKRKQLSGPDFKKFADSVKRNISHITLFFAVWAAAMISFQETPFGYGKMEVAVAITIVAGAVFGVMKMADKVLRNLHN